MARGWRADERGRARMSAGGADGARMARGRARARAGERGWRADGARTSAGRSADGADGARMARGRRADERGRARMSAGGARMARARARTARGWRADERGCARSADGARMARGRARAEHGQPLGQRTARGRPHRRAHEQTDALPQSHEQDATMEDSFGFNNDYWARGRARAEHGRPLGQRTARGRPHRSAHEQTDALPQSHEQTATMESHEQTHCHNHVLSSRSGNH